MAVYWFCPKVHGTSCGNFFGHVVFNERYIFASSEMIVFCQRQYLVSTSMSKSAPRFYCLVNSQKSDSSNVFERIDRLQKACESQRINFCALDESKVDFSELPDVSTDDMVFNCARGGFILEQVLLRSKPKSIYRSHGCNGLLPKNSISDVGSERLGVRVPKTIWYCQNDRQKLEKYVAHLGGFPIVLKVGRGFSGVGTLWVPDMKTLRGMADFFTKSDQRFMLRQFIPSNSCERLVVIGDKVIAATSRAVDPMDFRSSSKMELSSSYEPSDEAIELAVRAAKATGYEFAGVDLVYDQSNLTYYCLEVNSPHNFIPVEEITDVDIASAFVEWFVQK